MEVREMTLNEYQKNAMETCSPTSNNFSYMMLNLVGKVGELSSKVAKSIKHGEASIETCIDNDNIKHESDLFYRNDEEAFYRSLMNKAGDILCQLAGLCTVMGWDLDDVARMNLEKLASRKGKQ